MPSLLSPVPLAVVFLLIPLLLTQSPIPIPPFTPRQPIYTNNLFPLLLAPISPPPSLSSLLSRIVQATILLHLPSQWYLAWLSIAAVRCGLGHLLSRGVGWAYPFLFVHSALYEEIGGLGPVFALTYAFNASIGWPLAALTNNGNRRSDMQYTSNIKVPGTAWAQKYPQLSSALLLLSLCILDSAPWSYGIGATVGLLLSTLDTLRARFHPQDRRDPDSLPLNSSTALSPTFSSTPGSLSRTLFIVFGAFSILQITNFISYLTPPSLQPNVSFHIIVLSYPRPASTPESLLAETIESYLPLVTKHTSLTIYTADPDHKVFQRTERKYATDRRVKWFVEPPNENYAHIRPSQYLHLGQALRWAQGQSEWTMIIEDDFTLCGEWGSQSLTRVLSRLEELRPPDSPIQKRLGGFVGTGGSGIIIHRSLLPLLSDLLFVHTNKLGLASPRPADLILQHCLTGENSLCPGSGLVVSSRMIMEHKGGKFSTYRGRAYEDGKWLCGWRQPFHGRPEVDTVVV